MSRIFISYAREDIQVALKIYDSLRSKDFDVWLDKENLEPGERWKSVVESQIRECTYFLALVSSNSLNKRGYVQKELRLALDILEECPESEVFLIPVRLEDCKPSHAKLNELNWLDLFPSLDEGLKKLTIFLKSKIHNPSQYAIGEETTLAINPNKAGETPSHQRINQSSVRIAYSKASWAWGCARDYSAGGEDDIILKLKLSFLAFNTGPAVSVKKYEIELAGNKDAGESENVLVPKSKQVELAYELFIIDCVDNDTGSSICTMLKRRPFGTLRIWDTHGPISVCDFQIRGATLEEEYGSSNYTFYKDLM